MKAMLLKLIHDHREKCILLMKIALATVVSLVILAQLWIGLAVIRVLLFAGGR